MGAVAAFYSCDLVEGRIVVVGRHSVEEPFLVCEPDIQCVLTEFHLLAGILHWSQYRFLNVASKRPSSD